MDTFQIEDETEKTPRKHIEAKRRKGEEKREKEVKPRKKNEKAEIRYDFRPNCTKRKAQRIEKIV